MAPPAAPAVGRAAPRPPARAPAAGAPRAGRRRIRVRRARGVLEAGCAGAGHGSICPWVRLPHMSSRLQLPVGCVRFRSHRACKSGMHAVQQVRRLGRAAEPPRVRRRVRIGGHGVASGTSRPAMLVPGRGPSLGKARSCCLGHVPMEWVTEPLSPADTRRPGHARSQRCAIAARQCGTDKALHWLELGGHWQASGVRRWPDRAPLAAGSVEHVRQAMHAMTSASVNVVRAISAAATRSIAAACSVTSDMARLCHASISARTSRLSLPAMVLASRSM